MKNRYIISSLIIIIVLLGLSLMAWFKPATQMSTSERRPLAQFPELSVKTLLSGDFTSKFEDYATDQFPFRDDWRTLKAISKFYIFNQKDNNNIYIHNGYASKLDAEKNTSSVNSALEKLSYLYTKYVEGKTDKVYISIVPDKSATLAKEGGYPSLDYDKIANEVKEQLSWGKYIDIFPLLDYTDYYKTDTHWSQEKIVDVAEAIANAMNATVEKDYQEITPDKDFYGVYYGQSSLPLPPDKITYLTSDIINGCQVYNYEKDINTAYPIYDMEKLNSKDPYEMFLSGASFLMKIVNPACNSDRRLVIFRDSYTSSIAPLLVESYSEIYLVDTRYIYPDLVDLYIGEEVFTNADVLFLYSAMIINDSSALRAPYKE